MPLSAEQQFNKATFLLDRGEIDRGECLLREVIASANSLGNEVLAMRARCCLGELLTELGRATEARHLLHAVADHVPSSGLDDVLYLEQRTARNLLRRIDNEA